jgi:integrase
MKLRVDLRSPLSESTSSKRITNVKTVLNEAVNEGVVLPLDWPPRRAGAKRRSERPRKSVATTMRKKSVEPSATLFAIIEASTNPKWISNRYRGMTAVAGLAGLRPSEVFYLEIEDLQLPDDGCVGQIVVRDSDVRTEARWMIEEDTHEEGLVKTVESARVVPIPPRLVEELRRWITIRGITSGPLFNTTESAKSWPDSIRLACSKVGVAPHSPYDLRRMYASHMVDAGYSLADVAARMGNTIEILIKHYVLPVKCEPGVADAKLIAFYEAHEAI